MNNEVAESSGEMGAPLMGGRRKGSISIDRRRELMRLAEQASDWIIDHNIKPEELCFFKRSVEMLTDTHQF